MTALLEIDNLSVAFPDPQDHSKESRVLHEVSLNIEAGSTHGLVGESGSGKSITALSVLRLLDDVSTVRTSGSIRFNGQEMLHLAEEELRAIRGNRIAMITGSHEVQTSRDPRHKHIFRGSISIGKLRVLMQMPKVKIVIRALRI